MITVASFVAAVEATVGTPVVHMGRQKGVGLDCVGVPLAAFEFCGAPQVCEDRYQRLPDEEMLRAGLARYCSEIDRASCRPGDLLQVYLGKQARHLMVIVANGESGQFVVVHASGKIGSVRRTSIGPETKIHRVWRIRELDHG